MHLFPIRSEGLEMHNPVYTLFRREDLRPREEVSVVRGDGDLHIIFELRVKRWIISLPSASS